MRSLRRIVRSHVVHRRHHGVCHGCRRARRRSVRAAGRRRSAGCCDAETRGPGGRDARPISCCAAGSSSSTMRAASVTGAATIRPPRAGSPAWARQNRPLTSRSARRRAGSIQPRRDVSRRVLATSRPTMTPGWVALRSGRSSTRCASGFVRRTRLTSPSRPSAPGQGNFPRLPHYVAPPMPWTAWRHMPDADLRAIAAYLKRGLKPVVNKVAESEGPPDFWAGFMTPENIGVYPAPAFPAANEQPPPAAQKARVLRGTGARHRSRLRRLPWGPVGPVAKRLARGHHQRRKCIRVRPVLPGSKGAVLHRPAEEHHAGQGDRHRPLDGSAGLQRLALRTEA